MISFRDLGHGRKLFLSLWPGEKSTTIRIAGKRLNQTQIILVHEFCWKFPASICWYQDNILLIDYLQNSQTLNPQVYSAGAIEFILNEIGFANFQRLSCSCKTMPQLAHLHL
jgi:hypothetical protein